MRSIRKGLGVRVGNSAVIVIGLNWILMLKFQGHETLAG